MHFVDAGAWEECVEMYRKNNLWEDAVRVSRVHDDRNFKNEGSIKIDIIAGGNEQESNDSCF